MSLIQQWHPAEDIARERFPIIIGFQSDNSNCVVGNVIKSVEAHEYNNEILNKDYTWIYPAVK